MHCNYVQHTARVLKDNPFKVYYMHTMYVAVCYVYKLTVLLMPHFSYPSHAGPGPSSGSPRQTSPPHPQPSPPLHSPLPAVPTSHFPPSPTHRPSGQATQHATGSRGRRMSIEGKG